MSGPDVDDGATASGVAWHRSGGRDVGIAYETAGPADGDPLVLIMGIGAQRHGWPPGFRDELVERGFRVTRFDHRDTGDSTRFDDVGRAGRLRRWLRPGAAAAYTLEDMASDVVAVLDAQGWRRAHLVGVSMGGMVAQVAACGWPDRVRSLTSLSSGPAPRVGAPRPRTMLRLAMAASTPVTDVGSLARQMTAVATIVGSPAHPPDARWLRELAELTFEGRSDLAALQRHTAAIAASGDRSAGLAGLRVPTLVLHGEADPMIRPVAGERTAAAIPGAVHRTFPGMGHDLPRPFWPVVADAIASLAAESPQDARPGGAAPG